MKNKIIAMSHSNSIQLKGTVLSSGACFSDHILFLDTIPPYDTITLSINPELVSTTISIKDEMQRYETALSITRANLKAFCANELEDTHETIFAEINEEQLLAEYGYVPKELQKQQILPLLMEDITLKALEFRDDSDILAQLEKTIVSEKIRVITANELRRIHNNSKVNRNKNIETIIHAKLAKAYTQMSGIDSEYTLRFAEEVATIGREILSELGVVGLRWSDMLEGDTPYILVGKTIPADATRFFNSKVWGMVTQNDSQTGHVPLIAKARGIPMLQVDSVDPLFDKRNMILGLGLNTSKEFGVTINPNYSVITEILLHKNLSTFEARGAGHILSQPSETLDHFKFSTYLNLPGDFEKEELNGHVDGIGLLRTDKYFDSFIHSRLPTQDESIEAYTKTLRTYRGKPVNIRVFDPSPDKPIFGINVRERSFQGTVMHNKALYINQIQAILIAALAANQNEIQITFPMIETANDIFEAKELIDIARKIIANGANTKRDNLKVVVGAMIETPSSILNLDSIYTSLKELETETTLAGAVSVGTNDLFNLVLKEYRYKSDKKTGLQETDYDPVKLYLVNLVVTKAISYNIKVSLCGNYVSNANIAPLFIKRGASISLPPYDLIEIKNILVGLTIAKYANLSNQILSNSDVRNYFISLIPDWIRLKPAERVLAIKNAYETLPADIDNLGSLLKTASKAVENVLAHISQTEP